MSDPRLAVELAGLKLRNPVMSASGCFGYGSEYADFVDLNELGAVVVKATTLRPRAGNPPPRIWETPAGMLNAIGLQNEGVHALVEKKLPYLRQFDCPVIVNVAAQDAGEYAEVCSVLDLAEGISAIELNISCPNVSHGMDCGVEPQLAAQVVTAARGATRLPLICKLTPNVTDITLIAQAVADAGAHAVSLINTLLGMAIDPETRQPRLSNGMGGLSGPAVRPVAVRMVYQVSQAVNIPVIGIGGITCAADALEFILAGATAVQIGTACFVNHRVMPETVAGLSQYLDRHGLSSIRQLVGAVEMPRG